MQAKLCADENIPVFPIPGPSAIVAALSASGLVTNEFTFGNFPMNLFIYFPSKVNNNLPMNLMPVVATNHVRGFIISCIGYGHV